MARTRFPADRGLTRRMVLTMFLLGLLYVVFIGILLAVGTSFVVVLLIAGGLLFAQYAFSDRIALFSMNAHEVSAGEQPVLHGIVDRLCALADMAKPRIAIADTDLPNAFATGRDPDHAVVAVTTGLLRRLDEPQLEAVLAHELSHVAHRDVMVMTIASFLGITAGLLTRFALYSGMFGGFGGRRAVMTRAAPPWCSWCSSCRWLYTPSASCSLGPSRATENCRPTGRRRSSRGDRPPSPPPSSRSAAR